MIQQSVRPKKYLGQHFLTDRNIASKIVNALPSQENNCVLEVGPGKGILTELLVKRNDIQLKCVEIDSESVKWLTDSGIIDPNLIISGDFLKLDLLSLFDSEFSIIGNFPYNISSQILFRMLEYRNSIPCLVGMFQKEVAERIISSPGSKNYGILSVLTGSFYAIELLFTVGEQVFYPPPNVKSAVIRMTRKDFSEVPVKEYDFFRKIVRTAFGQRRKMLRNSLGALGISDFQELSVYLQKRPEQLSVDDFHYITKILTKT